MEYMVFCISTFTLMLTWIFVNPSTKRKSQIKLRLFVVQKFSRRDLRLIRYLVNLNRLTKITFDAISLWGSTLHLFGSIWFSKNELHCQAAKSIKHWWDHLNDVYHLTTTLPTVSTFIAISKVKKSSNLVQDGKALNCAFA